MIEAVTYHAVAESTGVNGRTVVSPCKINLMAEHGRNKIDVGDTVSLNLPRNQTDTPERRVVYYRGTMKAGEGLGVVFSEVQSSQAKADYLMLLPFEPHLLAFDTIHFSLFAAGLGRRTLCSDPINIGVHPFPSNLSTRSKRNWAMLDALTCRKPAAEKLLYFLKRCSAASIAKCLRKERLFI